MVSGLFRLTSFSRLQATPYICYMALVTPQILTDDAVRNLVQEADNEAQVTVHLTYATPQPGCLIRIWPSTYLVPQQDVASSKLITAIGIAIAPRWTILTEAAPFRFTLVFEALNKSVTLFHLWEDINQPGGFLVKNIRRNLSDVYYINLEP
jgi:hypothetical protein